MAILKKFWPVFAIVLIVFTIALTNTTPGTRLTGWDNLQTDLDIGINLKRAVFSAWEEYQGVGHVAGNAHLADIPRQVLTLIMSPIIPGDFIRQFYAYLMLISGSLGAYFLIKKLFFEDKNDPASLVFPFIGGLFYLFNLSTIQTFYVPLEPYLTHFGFLPWLLLSAVLFLRKNSRKNWIFLITTNLIAIPQSQVPTLFFVYLGMLFLLILCALRSNRNRETLKKSFNLMSTIIILNLFWFLPFLYFLITNSHVAFEAKINQMSTQTVFLQNKAFGDPLDVILLKGFWFNNVDPNLKGSFVYMLDSWRQHFSLIYVQIIGILFFAIGILGLITSVKKRTVLTLSVTSIFIVTFTMLATDTLPFSIIDALIRKIGIFDEVLRFPYTKFAILYSLSYSILFVLGLEKVFKLSSKFIKKEHIRLYVVSSIATLCIFIFCLPVFGGNMFYSKEKLVIPNEYLQTFEFFKNTDQNTRIANFPQYAFWGWSYYKWGYGGSGFLWYGIDQPILDRAYDVWSRASENYYWEISNALYSKNPKAFLSVLNKYQVNFLLVDKNIFDPSSNSDLFASQLENMVEKIPGITKVKTFGNIDIYKVALADNPKNFVFATTPLNEANGYNFGSIDQAYKEIGNYEVSQSPNYYYPFRSLFSGKLQENQEFSLKDDGNSLTFSSKIPQGKNVTAIIPSFIADEKTVGIEVSTTKGSDGALSINLSLQAPTVSVVNKNNSSVIYSQDVIEPILDLPVGYGELINLNINGVKNFQVDPRLGEKNYGSSFLSLKSANTITVSSADGTNLTTKYFDPDTLISSLGSLNSVSLPEIDKDSQVQVKIPKVNDNFESFNMTPTQDLLSKHQVLRCNNINKGTVLGSIVTQGGPTMLKLEALDTTACIAFAMPNLIHDQGYVFFTKTSNISGRSLHVWLSNDDEKFSPIDTYVKDGKDALSSFVVPPQEEFGTSYTLHFDNISIGRDKTVNLLQGISLYPIPYNFLTGIKFYSAKDINNSLLVNKDITVKHPNPDYYEVVGLTKGSLAVLSQSYDNGWKAYEVDNNSLLQKTFPFFFGSENKNHILINNWENGWKINSDGKTLVILFLPQYLVYVGILLSIFFIASIAINHKIK